MAAIIKLTEDMEKRIFSNSRAYQYPEPNPGNTDLNSRMKYWEKRCDDAMVKLSKIGGDKLLKNNPGITDLSDEDRPMKIGDLMLNVYDNQWSDAIEDIEGGTVHEELAVAILYKTLMTAHKLCQTNKQLTDDEKAAMVLKEVENVYDSVKFEEATNVYIKYCTHVCTHMLKQNVPLVFGKPPEKGRDIDRQIYSEFMTSGQKVEYLVWRDCELVCVFAYHYPLREISTMKQKELLAFAKEAAKSMKTEKDLSDFSRMLKKVTVEAALGAELDDHLGYGPAQRWLKQP